MAHKRRSTVGGNVYVGIISINCRKISYSTIRISRWYLDGHSNNSNT